MKACHGSSLEQLARYIVPQQSRQTRRRSQSLVQIDSCIEAHELQHVYDFFAADVACGTRGVGTATQATQRRVEAASANAQGRCDIGKSHAARIVEVQRQIGLRILSEKPLGDALDLRRPARGWL